MWGNIVPTCWQACQESTLETNMGLNDPIIWCNYDTLGQTQMTHKNESRLVQENFAMGSGETPSGRKNAWLKLNNESTKLTRAVSAEQHKNASVFCRIKRCLVKEREKNERKSNVPLQKRKHNSNNKVLNYFYLGHFILDPIGS